MKKKIMVSAVEISGDMHAANLVRQLKIQYPELEFFGAGSSALKKCGMDILVDLSDKSTIGIFEPLRYLGKYLQAFWLLKEAIRERKPDLLICIDGQGFNLPLASFAKKEGVKVVYYISPQEWLWGTESGGKKVAELCDLIIAIFPEEAEFYSKLGAKTVYNGHPLVEVVKADISKEEFIAKYDLDETKPILAFFPGSRQQELNYLLPVFLQLTKKLEGKYNNVFVAASNKYYAQILAASKGYDANVILQDNYNAMAAADLILASTGTITLEAALIGTPLLAVYKMNPLSYWLLIKMIGERMPKYKALPNMLAGREIIPEFIQENVTADRLYQEIQLLKPEKLQGIRQDLKLLKEELQKENVLAKNAQAIGEILGA